VKLRSRTPDSPDEPADWRTNARIVASGVAGVLLLWFALGNLKSVSIDFWVKDTKAPLIVVIAISGLLGALISVLARRHRTPRE
jgi:uncharacterized integral membrane protein